MANVSRLMVWLLKIGQSTEQTCTLLPFTSQAVLSPLAMLVHSDVILFLSLKNMFAFFNDLSVQLYLFLFCLKCHVWVCTESPLSHSGLSNQGHISLRSPLPCHRWLGKKKITAHSTLSVVYGLPALSIAKPAESSSKLLWLAYYYFLPIHLTIDFPIDPASH